MSRNASIYILPALVLCVASTIPAFAQDISSEAILDFRKSIIGREIMISGSLGSGLDFSDDEALFFKDEEGNVYPVVFDAGRNARRATEGCRFAMFGDGTPCRMSGLAEIELDGSRLRLIIFEVSNISPPGG